MGTFNHLDGKSFQFGGTWTIGSSGDLDLFRLDDSRSLLRERDLGTIIKNVFAQDR